MRVEQFHQFYVKIQEIQSTLTKNNSIVVENFECDLKLDDDLSNDLKDFDLSQEIEFGTATSWPGIKRFSNEGFFFRTTVDLFSVITEIADESSEHSRTDAENDIQNDTKSSTPTIKE